MSAIRRIFFTRAKGVPGDPEAASVHSAAPHAKKLREPSTHLTAHQAFYLFGMNGVGSMVISGGINLAIAYGMYANQTSPVRLFRLPNTFAGDAAVTIIVQSIVTWLLTCVMVNGDLRSGGVQPIGFISEPRRPRILRWYLFLDAEQPTERKNGKQWFTFIVTQILRGFLWSVMLFFLVWPATVGILTFGDHRDNDYYYPRRWTPQIFKLILGAVLGLLCSPWFAGFWLVTVGWRIKREEAVLARRSIEAGTAGLNPSEVPAALPQSKDANPINEEKTHRRPPSSTSTADDTVTTTQSRDKPVKGNDHAGANVLAPPLDGRQL
ncbi:hypothetical protein PYCC9005_004309 [Savitreella phatthalungensis]